MSLIKMPNNAMVGVPDVSKVRATGTVTPTKTAPRQTAPKKITVKHVAVGRGGYTQFIVDGEVYKNRNEAEIAAAVPTQEPGGEIKVTQERQPRGLGPKKYTVGGKTYTSRAQAQAASRGVALEEYSTRGGTGVAHRVTSTAKAAQAQVQAGRTPAGYRPRCWG